MNKYRVERSNAPQITVEADSYSRKPNGDMDFYRKRDNGMGEEKIRTLVGVTDVELISG